MVCLAKEAAVFGEGHPGVSRHRLLTDPKTHLSEHESYYHRKAKEAPTHAGKAALIGAGVGATAGAALGLMSGYGGRREVGVGALVGGLGGAFTGATAAMADHAAINDAKAISRMQPKERRAHLRSLAAGALEHQDSVERAKQSRRHQEMMDRLDSLERRR